MNPNRNIILVLVAIIGVLFSVLTYVRDSLTLGVIGIAFMLLLWWISKEDLA